MLILNSARCANDGGGMACGPVDASCMVELDVNKDFDEIAMPELKVDQLVEEDLEEEEE